MLLSKLIFLLCLGIANAAVIVHYLTETVDTVTKTPDPVYVTVTKSKSRHTVTKTKKNMITKVATIYTAKVTPTSTPSGTVVTSIVTETKAPVTQASSYPTTALSATIDTEAYSTAAVSIPAITGSVETQTTSYNVVISSTISANVEVVAATDSSAATSSHGNSGRITTTKVYSLPVSGSASASGSVSCYTSTFVIEDGTTYPISSAPSTSATTSANTSLATSLAISVLSSASANEFSNSTSSAATTTSGQLSFTTTLYAVAVETSAAATTVVSPINQYYEDGDIITAIATDVPPSVFSSEALDITLPTGINNNGKPIHTNKFYDNLILGTQKAPIYSQPYSLWWSNNTDYYGMAISYTLESQVVYGPDASANPVEYYINPVGLMSAVFSAKEFTASNMELSTSDFDTFSVTASLSNTDGAIDFPITLGMGLVTAKYNGLTPRIFSQLGFKTVTKQSGITTSSYNIEKYVGTLFNGVHWAIYVSQPQGVYLNLTVDSDYQITANDTASGVIIQIGILPTEITDLTVSNSIDTSAGMYVTGAKLEATVKSDVATYTLQYSTEGESTSGTPFLYALPHQVDSFTSDMSSAATSYTCRSTTKGTMTGYLTNKLIMSETLHTGLQFLPWSSNASFTGVSYTSTALSAIASAASSELNQDIASLSDTDSTYTSGKIFDKFAYIVLVAKDILQDDAVTEAALNRLKSAFSLFTNNTQQTPFIYDTTFKGVTSSAAQNGGNPNDDYGSPYYNDHHFHYGYLVHTAAIIGYVDSYFNGTWVNDHKDWVNALVRDVANPSSSDSYFPVFRSFDWYNGHSWAAGLFESSDGKNEESTSEDVNFAYGMKLWGKVVGDKAMEARGDLMLSVLARSLDAYFLLKDDNENQPSNFIGNKVAGISYENKLDHTTFFGTNEEYIQGIQMIPITPASGLTRSPEFVSQEWSAKLESLVSSVDSGWLGILRSNQALINPTAAYNFFSQDNFSSTWLDNGASLTWYLALSAGLGGSS